MEKTICTRGARWISYMKRVTEKPSVCLECNLRMNCNKYLQGDLILKEKKTNIPKVNTKWYGELKIKN